MFSVLPSLKSIVSNSSRARGSKRRFFVFFDTMAPVKYGTKKIPARRLRNIGERYVNDPPEAKCAMQSPFSVSMTISTRNEFTAKLLSDSGKSTRRDASMAYNNGPRVASNLVSEPSFSSSSVACSASN